MDTVLRSIGGALGILRGGYLGMGIIDGVMSFNDLVLCLRFNSAASALTFRVVNRLLAIMTALTDKVLSKKLSR